MVINRCQCQPMHPSLMCEEQSYACSCQLNKFHGVCMSCHVWTLCKVFRKWNCFGDDVISEQSSHPCLVIQNGMCYVTPSIFLSSFPLPHTHFTNSTFQRSINIIGQDNERKTPHEKTLLKKAHNFTKFSSHSSFFQNRVPFFIFPKTFRFFCSF